MCISYPVYRDSRLAALSKLYPAIATVPTMVPAPENPPAACVQGTPIPTPCNGRPSQLLDDGPALSPSNHKSVYYMFLETVILR